MQVTCVDYDALNRLTSLTATNGAGLLASFAYGLERAGHRTNLVETVNGAVRTNVVNELQKVFGSGSRGSAWDIVSDIPEEMRIATQLAR